MADMVSRLLDNQLITVKEQYRSTLTKLVSLSDSRVNKSNGVYTIKQSVLATQLMEEASTLKQLAQLKERLSVAERRKDIEK